MNHPSAPDLALYSGGDLGLLERWRVRRHLGSCTRCRHEVDGYRTASAELVQDAAVLPAGLNWDRLAAEMTANIHVGLEAAECVAPARSFGFRPVWRAALVMTAMFLVVATAWFLNPPSQSPHYGMRGTAGIELRNTSTGLELNENGSVFVLLHGRGIEAQRPIISSQPGALRARMVDAETGQITINHVYAD